MKMPNSMSIEEMVTEALVKAAEVLLQELKILLKNVRKKLLKKL